MHGTPARKRERSFTAIDGRQFKLDLAEGLDREQRHGVVGGSRDQYPSRALLFGKRTQVIVQKQSMTPGVFYEPQRAQVLPHAVVPRAVATERMRTMFDRQPVLDMRARDQRFIERGSIRQQRAIHIPYSLPSPALLSTSAYLSISEPSVARNCAGESSRGS